MHHTIVACFLLCPGSIERKRPRDTLPDLESMPVAKKQRVTFALQVPASMKQLEYLVLFTLLVRSVWLVARLLDVRFNTPPCGCAFVFTVVHARLVRKLLLVLLAVNSCCY